MPAMITLNGFGPAFGLPDPSPFVTKVEVLLKMTGLEFRTAANGLRKAPKRKLPYIDDGGTILADSTFIRWHIEKKYGFDFDRDLSAEELRSPGRSRSWRRSISIGRSSIRAGWMMEISTRGHANSSSRCPPHCGPW
jgi:glutathione S-transferase